MLEILMLADIGNCAFSPARSVPLLFASKDPPFTISIKPKNPDSQGVDSSRTFVCRMKMKVPATEAQLLFVRSLIRGRVLPGYDLPYSLPLIGRSGEIIDSNGIVEDGASFWIEWLPSDLRSLIEGALVDQIETFRKFMSILGWQQAYANVLLDSNFHPIFYWRVPRQKQFYSMPNWGKSLQDVGPYGISWTEHDLLEVDLLWRRMRERIPLAHELRGEAERISDTYPRSSILMSFSALEVGVKAHIGAIVPKANWLAANVPSPPVYKIFRDYLPTLHPDRPNEFWKALQPTFKKFQKLAEIRNVLTHVGKLERKVDAHEYLRAVKDGLYILDYLAGHDWATEHLSHNLRKGLNLGLTRKPTIRFGVIWGPGNDLLRRPQKSTQSPTSPCAHT